MWRFYPVSLLVLLLLGMILTSFYIEPVKAVGPIFIRVGGNIDPPGAPISTDDNVVYVLTGKITSGSDGIIVEKDGIVVDGSGFVIEGIGLDNSCGICLNGISNVTIRETNIKNFWYGTWLGNCSGNNMNENNITNNYYGIALVSSPNNTISGNNVTDNGNGIWTTDSSKNRIDGNTIARNSDIGIGIYYSSSYCSVSENAVTGNTYGLVLGSFSDRNSIGGNMIVNNRYGIDLNHSPNNTVYHNNMINNTVQLNDATPEYGNFWDNGCEGNYWSNYNGTDMDNDGVGDALLPWEGVDNYPLMNMYWNRCDITHDLKVDMRDVGKSAKAFGTISGDTLWNPHADITGPQPPVPDGKVDMRDISLIAQHYGERHK